MGGMAITTDKALDRFSVVGVEIQANDNFPRSIGCQGRVIWCVCSHSFQEPDKFDIGLEFVNLEGSDKSRP